MNWVYQNGQNQKYEKTHPGCLGRMVNLFEVNLGGTMNKLLTDKPHRDGSPLSRSRSDVSRMSPSRDLIEDKVIVPEFRNASLNKKSNVTPMKMLIAQEMSKETDHRRNPPNLVAKLMGLDSLPPQPDSTTAESHFRCHPRRHSDIPLSYWEHQNGAFNYDEPNECKDFHEIWNKSPQKGRYNEVADEKRMALVRQKFDEAKRLSMDVNLRQSKQFQDALEVLNSNKDLFIKCLQEPNSIFSEHLYNLHSLPFPAETKRITVLKPSKVAEGDKQGKQMKNNASPPSGWKNYKNVPQSTRIVVLKPSPGKPHDIRATDSPHAESPRVLIHGEYFSGDVEDEYDDDQESREVARAITQHMRERLGRHRKDETLISSVFSNGYVGDESSFNKSEMHYDAGNLSDSEAVSPVSKQSWDYFNRIGSPYSCSSFSRASCSPESSVCREAKKRLSERWAMMASNGSYQEQRQVRRSSSTLGEMLALSEAKKAVVPAEECISSEEVRQLNSVLVNEQKKAEILDDSSRNLMRSKSVPVSSTEFGSRLNVDVSVLDSGKQDASKEETKVKNAKSSFRGKVSNLFFSMNKKPNKDKSISSETKHQEDPYTGELGTGKPESVSGNNHLSLGVMEPSSKASFWNLIDKHNMSNETVISGNSGENQDQPSPISVLNPPFEDNVHTARLLPQVKSEEQGIELPLNSLRSNLIDKSPPIGSIARTLSWDESCVDTASSYPVNESLTSQQTDEEEQELFSFVKTLLSAAGLEGDAQSNLSLTRWHSPDSPLDPTFRDTFVDLKDKDTLHEAQRRRNRSIRKLVFDSVNVALIEISGHGHDVSKSRHATLLDEVWAAVTLWFNGARCVSDYNDDSTLIVEKVVRKEVVGNGWINELSMELDYLGSEIEGQLLEELVQETLAELTDRT